MIVFAADHGVARAREVSAYPADVTASMVQTFARDEATVCALARAAQASLEVVDLGVIGLPEVVQTCGSVAVVRRVVAPGSRDMCERAALSPEMLERALEIGAERAARAARAGVDTLAIGEMGIGNTTSASALAAAYLDVPCADVVGPGTGLEPSGMARKQAAIEQALGRAKREAQDAWSDPYERLRQVGGLEIAAMTGCLIEAARRDIGVILDGFIVGSAAVAAYACCPESARVMIPATCSTEPGHRLVLAHLGLRDEALLSWRMRLGEASAAALALPLCRAACRILDEVATLDEVLAHT